MSNREQIYNDIRAEAPYVLRHELTPRVWAVMDALLDQLVEIQHEEALELLSDPSEVGYGNPA